MNKEGYPIVDCHCDTLWHFMQDDYSFGKINPKAHVDLPRMLKGRVVLQFFAVCVATSNYNHKRLPEALKYINLYHRCLEEHRGIICGIRSIEDLNRAEDEKKIACLLALEGAEPLEGSLELLEVFFRLGVRSLGLTWNNRNLYADGCAEEETRGGLTRIGREVIPQLSRLGIVLDIAHLSSQGFFDALELVDRPPLVSHANVRRMCDHPRNLTDHQLKCLAEKKGVLGMSFYPQFIAGDHRAALDQLADHYVHAALVAGVEHLAIGSDFDGINAVVDGLEDSSCYGTLLEALAKRGFLMEELELIARGNVMRLLRDNLPKGETI